jgi:hypothetical protein
VYPILPDQMLLLGEQLFPGGEGTLRALASPTFRSGLNDNNLLSPNN